MNKDVQTFLNRNGVTKEEIIKKTDSHIYNPTEINEIIDKYGLYFKKADAKVCIDEIAGYNTYGQNDNIFDSLNVYFDSQGSERFNRSIGMLNYTNTEIIKALSSTFINEPIVIKEIDQGKYIIDENGFHRFTILKAHYLIEKSRLQNLDDLKQLNEKYTIPVKVKQADYLKSYANFILKLIDPEYQILLGIDYDYNLTGNTLVIKNNKKVSLNDADLIEYVRAMLQTANQTTLDVIAAYRQKYQSFNAFLSTYNLLDNMSKDRVR